jgi:hypothetical protein
MRALAILFLVPGFSLGLIAGVTHVVGPLDPVPVKQTSLMWSNRVFATRGDFESWLTSRGSNYELWSRRHPAAARHFEDVSLRSRAASSSGQQARRPVQSRSALLIAIISSTVILAMLALPKLVRSTRVPWDPRTGRRFARSRARSVAAVPARPRGGATAQPRMHAPIMPSLPAAVPLDWRKGWSTVGRVGGGALAARDALAARSRSRLVRHYLPKVTLYAAAVVLSFAIGAWVAIYL